MITTTQILAAVHARFIGDATITGLVPAGSIGAYVLDESAYPYIQYELDFESMQVKGEDAQEVTLIVNIWTNYRGPKECMEIADAVRAEFDGVPVTIASGDGFGCSYESMDHFQEPEGTSYRCTVLFSMLYGDV